MSLEELIQLINFKYLNTKVNNYIICGLQNGEKKEIIAGVNPVSPICNYLVDDESFNADERTNIVVDLDDLAYFNILDLALNQLGIDDKLKLETFRDLNRFVSLLRKNKKSVQFIIANADKLNKADGRILNILLRFKSYFFNSIILLEDGKDLATYQVDLWAPPYLDYRDDYQKLNLIRY